MSTEVPENLKYSADHEWLILTEGVARVGITAFAADALGDVVFVDLPAVGTQITGGEACGELESTKSVSEMFAPAHGEITEINQAVVDDPGLVNTEPFGEGWLFEMSVSELPDLLDAAAYAALIAEG